MSSLADEDSDDDLVVEEYDVYVSPIDHLRLLQYPLAPPSEPTAARVKPRHGMLQVEHLHEGETRVYDSTTIPISTHLCLARKLPHKHQLHLLPLTHIQQLRPSLQHLHPPPAAPAPQDEKVVLQRKETDRAVRARQNSYAYQRASQDDEGWVDLLLQPAPDEIPELKASQQSLVDESLASNDDYLKSLQYGNNKTTTTTAPEAAAHSLVAQLTHRMRSGRPFPYSLLRTITDNEPELLQALSVCSVLVQGNFVLNSKLVSSSVEPVREIALLLLHRDGRLDRPRLQHAFPNVSPERLLLLLQPIAVQDRHHWVLRIEPDESFVLSYPDVVEEHRQHWERQSERYADLLRLYDEAADHV